MQACQALVAWAVYFPPGADMLAADFGAKLANSTTASTIWALSSFFQVGSVLPAGRTGCHGRGHTLACAGGVSSGCAQALGNVSVADVTSAANVSLIGVPLDALNPPDTLTVSAPAPARSSAGRATLALLAVGACAATVLLLV